MVPNAYSSDSVSLSTIPSSIIARVEVITGGSSAIYGSDAVAGVVNIITEKDKTGLGIETRGGVTSEGGGEEYSIALDYGTEFADGRGYFFVGGSYDEQEGIDHYDRARAQLETNFEYDSSLMCNAFQIETGDHVCGRDISPSEWRDRSDGTAGGVFEEGRGNWWYNENGLQTGWQEERDGYFSREFDVIKIPTETTTIAAKLDYEFSDSLDSYFQVQYSRETSFNFKSPEDDNESSDVIIFDPVTGAPGEIRPGHIPIDNPFVPALIANDPVAQARGELDWDRRFFEVGNITTDNTRTTIRTWAGLRGAFDNGWDWDVSVGYGDFKQEQLRSNELNIVRVQQALDAEFAPDGVTIQCADPAARAEGCVPLNLFGIGSITPGMADWIRANPTIDNGRKQTTVIGYVSGDLFDMPAGTVSAVFGAEYRKEELDLRVGGGHETGGITFNVVPAFSGEIDVSELFAEIAIPLADRLSVEAGMRVADYSPPGVNTVFSYSTGLMWEPVDGYNFRANFARAQRAPTIAELESPPRGDFDSYDDICDGVTATSTDPGHDNCRLDPLVAAVVASDGVFDDENNGYSPNGGNPDLFEETADTYTLGISIAPSSLEGFRLAVDYYDITVDDAIDSVENTEILAQCYNSSIMFGDPNPFCDAISRDADGQINQVLQQEFNLNETATSGFDVAIEYYYDMGRYGGLEFTANYTHINEYKTTFEGNDGLETVDFNNQLDFGIFEDVARASLTWRTDNWRVRWSTKWQGPIVDHNDRVEDYKQDFADNDTACAAGDPSCITNPEVPAFLFYPSTFRHSLSVAYDTELRSGANLRLSGGVRNLFNDDPFVPRTGDNLKVVLQTTTANSMVASGDSFT